VQPVTEKAQWP